MQKEGIRVASLWIYPVKGMAGIEVTESFVLHKGLQYDRRWMLINENNRFISQRDLPALALCKIELCNTYFTVSYNNEQIEVPLEDSGRELTAAIWNDLVSVQELPSALNKTISNWFGEKLRLVSFAESGSRKIDTAYTAGEGTTSLSDGYPILLIGQASLDLLNKKLETPIPMNRFRPNIVASGLDAFEEDSLGEFLVGTTKMKAVKPCARCTVTTINQETGVAGAEPLKTLATFRKHNNNVHFGMNVIPIETGKINMGDFITTIKSSTL